jgi:hypothetical protein
LPCTRSSATSNGTYPLPAGDDRLIAFLDSTIGNLYPHRRHTLFTSVARAIGAQDFDGGVAADRDQRQVHPRRHRTRAGGSGPATHAWTDPRERFALVLARRGAAD